MPFSQTFTVIPKVQSTHFKLQMPRLLSLGKDNLLYCCGREGMASSSITASQGRTEWIILATLSIKQNEPVVMVVGSLPVFYPPLLLPVALRTHSCAFNVCEGLSQTWAFYRMARPPRTLFQVDIQAGFLLWLQD